MNVTVREQARIDWLRAAAKQGFDDIDRGDYITLRGAEEIGKFVEETQRRVRARLAKK